MIGQWRWRVAYAAAVAVIGAMVATSLWLWFQLRSYEVADFEREAIRQATAASISPQLADEWLAGSDELQQELVELSLVTGAQVTALTVRGEYITQSHRANG